MRNVSLLAVSGLLITASLSGACARSVGEPLRGNNDFSRSTARDLPVNEQIIDENQGTDVVTEEPVADDPLKAELVATISFASEQAYLTADAGLAHDRVAAESFAVALADAAALVQQRAVEIQSAAGTTEECGCGGCSEVPVATPEVDDAVLFSALAAEAAADVASELDPPSETVCSGGCGGGCSEQPGTVDEVALGAAIDAATDAGEGCAAAGAALETAPL